ncbi:uncharacterized protein LOC135940312 [Cloeon dipterum]|uniref:uncharacterized protein LOC135940312 n=1 Tax=Cloeon dipterum TaxID=197152 RepID=UPI00321F77A6
MITRILLLLFYGSAFATGDSSPAKCASYCLDNSLIFEKDATLEYSYSGSVETILTSQETLDKERGEPLELNATVIIRTVSPCEISLELKDVRSSSENEGASFVDLLTGNPLRASFQDGRVEAVCAPSSENRWALNVKKAILSAFQMPLGVLDQDDLITVHETDVSGVCRTQYKTLSNEEKTVVSKTKDLTQCSGRRGKINLELPYVQNSAVHLLKGQQECEQTLAEGRLLSSKCRETQALVPFSDKDGGESVKTLVSQIINLESVTRDVSGVEPLSLNFSRSSLLFDYGEYDEKLSLEAKTKPEDALVEVKTILHELSSDGGESAVVTADTAKLFGTLVHAMAKLDADHLKQVVTDERLSDAKRGFIMDVLPSLDSHASIDLMSFLYMERAKQIPKIKSWMENNAASWFASLAYSRKVESASMKPLQKLLVYCLMGYAAESDVSSIVLGITGLARKYCENSGDMDSCGSHAFEILSTLEQVLMPDSQASEKIRIVALKGLGNIGAFTNGRILRNKILNESLSIEERLVAIDSFRRVSCPTLDTWITSTFLNTFTDTSQDTEIRIAAYLMTIRCPTPAIVRAIKRSLYSETVNQVGSFVWTHLTNGQESTAKGRQVLRSILANEFLQNKFKTDARQFSRNYEGSQYFQSLGIGTNLDANLIFSTKSYLPRSAMMNLTVDVFGESINLFEVGGRAEGFEPMVERLFAKNGAFENEALEGFLKNARQDEQYESVRNKTVPMKRSTKPRASGFLRVNGQEVSYLELEDVVKNAYRFNFQPKELLRNLLSKKEVDLQQSAELLNLEREFPTLMGLPLRLKLAGTSSVTLKLSASFERKNAAFQMSAMVKPSASVLLTGTMSVGQDGFEQGVRIEASLFTKTSVDNRLSVTEDGKVSFKAHVPEEKQTLIDLRTERLTFNGHSVRRLGDLSDARDNSSFCSGEWVDGLSGLRFCSDLSFPNATLEGGVFPFNGNSRLLVTLEKSDPDFEAYEFHSSWTHMPGRKYDYSLVFDRVGSEQRNKRRAVILVFDRDAGVASAELDVPEKQAAISILWDNTDFSAGELAISYDRVNYVDIVAKIDHQKKTMFGTNEQFGKIEPEIKFKVKRLPEFHLKGTINYSGKSKLTADLNVSGLTEKPIILAIDYNTEANFGGINARINVDSQYITWDVKANAKVSPSSLGLRLNGVYNATAEKQHTFEIITKCNWNQQGALKRGFLNLKSNLSQWPQYSGQLQTDVMLSKGYYESNVKLSLTNEEWNITQRLQVSGPVDVWLKQTVQCPQRQINFLLEHRHKAGQISSELLPRMFSTTTQLNVDEKHRANFHLDYKYIEGDGITFSAESELLWPRFTFSNGTGPHLQSRVRQVLPGEYDVFFITQWTDKRPPVKINAVYKDKGNQKKLNHFLNGTLAGVFGFTELSALGVQAKFQAVSHTSNFEGRVTVGASEKCEFAVLYEHDKLEKKSVAAKMNVWRDEGVKKEYQLNGTFQKSEEELLLSFDVLMSRLISFEFRNGGESDFISLFWDKANDANKNITLLIEHPRTNEISVNLLFPGQNIFVSGNLRYLTATSKSDSNVHLSGHAVSGRVAWSPGREISFAGSYKGNLNLGLEVLVEVSTKNLPVVGSHSRKLEGEFTPGKSERGGRLIIKHAWRTNGQKPENLEAQILIEKDQENLNIEFSFLSSLWHPKSVTGRVNNNFKDWTAIRGNVSTHCGEEGVSFAWDWNLTNGASVAVQSNWEKISSTKFEVKYNVPSESHQGVLQNWILLQMKDNIWKMNVNVKKEKTFTTGDYVFELRVETPMKDFENHLISAKLNRNNNDVDFTSIILTPLIGDYALNLSNRHIVETNKLKAKLTVSNQGDSVTDLRLTATHIPISQGVEAEISLYMPDILEIKSEVTVVVREDGADAKVNYFSNDELLHDFKLGLEYENEGDWDKLSVDFSGYSYMVMPSRWKLVVKLEGTNLNHTGYLEVNKLILEHKFEFNENESSCAFDLKGVADQKEILNVGILYEDVLDGKYFLTVMGTQVFDVQCQVNLGYVNMMFMNKALQILTRVSDENEMETNTRIIASGKLYATVKTSVYLRFKDDEGGVESAIISLDVVSEKNSANVQVNLDAWRRLVTNVKGKYEDHKAELELDVLSTNNTLSFKYWKVDDVIFYSDAYVYFEIPAAAVGVVIHEGPFKLRAEAEGAVDEDMVVYAVAQVDSDDSIYFPMSVKAQWQLPQDDPIKTGGRVIFTAPGNLNIKFSGHLDYTDANKYLNATLLQTMGEGEHYEAHTYEVLASHKTFEKQYLFARYRYDEEKVEVEVMLTEMMLETKLITPIQNYKYVSLKAGVAERSETERQILEFVRDEYIMNAELLFKKNKMIGSAKSNNGFELESSMTKIETEASTDVAIEVVLNKISRVEAGVYMQYGQGVMDVAANVTRNGETHRMQSVIMNTSDKKRFGIKTEYMKKRYEMEIYSTRANEGNYSQGFRLATQGLASEFHYEKTEQSSAAIFKYQEQYLKCQLNGSTTAGSLHVTQKNGNVGSQMTLAFDFEGKIDTEFRVRLNEQLSDSDEVDIPLFAKAIVRPGQEVHLSFYHGGSIYLFEGSIVKKEEEIKINGATITPYFEAIRLNASYSFESTQKCINTHLDIGSDFYELKSNISMDGSYSIELNMDAKSSVPDYEAIKIKGGFSNNEKFKGVLQMIFPTNTYKIAVEYSQEAACSLKLETDDNEYLFKYVRLDDNTNFVEYFRDQNQLLNSTFVFANESLLVTIMTPFERFNNLTFDIGYGANLPSKNLVVHKNNEVVFMAQMFPIDQEDIASGTGITATIYQGDQKFVYDAQFSIDNPVFIVLKQHEDGNVTRDILHFSLNVTDENSASGKAEIMLPISPNTKLLAKGQIQIENKNAEFKMSYKFDEEEENNFAIHYFTYTDNYNIYNIVTNLTTPFKGYESMSLRITSSWTETVVKFTSQLPSYENIALIAVHRLEGPQKELWVQYQNMKKSALFVKALFHNEPNNKRIELSTQTPFLNGQALASNNGTVMEIMVEHEGITLCQIISKFEEITNGNIYEFSFKKPEKVFKLKSKLVKQLGVLFEFDSYLDNELLAKIDFIVDALGSFSSNITVKETQYEMTGTLNWLEKSINLVIKNQDNFQAKLQFVLLWKGFVKISSTEIQHDINVAWIFSESLTNFNISRGEVMKMDFSASEDSLEFKYERNGKEYSFTFGQTRPTGWPNILLKIVWDDESLIDFLHEFLTDAHLLIVRTRLTSPFLGNHKNMKFSLTLKTKSIIEIEAEFKWRPKDVTLFTAALQMDRLAALASVAFVSPFNSNFTFNAQFDFSGAEKTFAVVYVLGNVVSIEGSIQPTGDEQSISIKLRTPIVGYSTVDLVASHKVNGKSQRAEMHFTKETDKKSIEIFYDDRNLKANAIINPELRCVLSATYEKKEGIHNIQGFAKWSGTKEPFKFEGSYKPREKFSISLTSPQNEKYSFDHKMIWQKEKKAVDVFIQKADETMELSGSLSTQENLNVLIASIKSTWFSYVKISAISDSKTNELGGALQIEDSAYSMKASQVVGNTYDIKLYDGQEEKYNIQVTFEGEYRSGLKVALKSTTPGYKFTTDAAITANEEMLHVSSSISWGDGETVYFSLKNSVNTEIECVLNTENVKDSEVYLSFGSNFITAMMRNQSETYKGGLKFELGEFYSINGTYEISGKNYEVLTYYDPNEIKLHVAYAWPRDKRIETVIVLKPGDVSMTLKTPYIQYHNIQINGKYSEHMTYNDYQLASTADAKWNDFLVTVSGVIKSSQNNYGLDGRLVWDSTNEMRLKFGVIASKQVNFELKTPFRGLPYFSAQLEALKYRHLVSGISGVLRTPFEKLPVLNFTFNTVNEEIEMKFSFDTATYKNVSIHTILKSKNGKYLHMQIHAPFFSHVKHLIVNARTSKLIGKNGQETMISLHLDEKEYSIHNNYTLLKRRLDSYVFMKGPNIEPIVIRFGGQFEMESMESFDLETYFNDILLGFQYKSDKDLLLRGRICLSTIIPIPNTDFTLNLVRSSHFEGRFDYSYGDFTGNALVKNKLQKDSLETVLYLNLPHILKYPLQVELTANYNQPRLQFNGFASFMAEHRLELVMVQTSFRTTLNAELDSAFFKGKNKFELTLSGGSLSVSINDEIKITGMKKTNQLMLTLSQVSSRQDHTLTYNWDLSQPPTFDVTLESPVLASKKATFSATYLGAFKGVNIKLVSGSESMKLDYDVVNQTHSKGLRLVVGNSQTQLLNLAAYLDQTNNGHKLLAELNLFEIDYKAVFEYSLPVQSANPNLEVNFFLSLPYLFPFRLLDLNVKTGKDAEEYFINSNIAIDNDKVNLNGKLVSNQLSIDISSTFEEMRSLSLEGSFAEKGEQQSVNALLVVNGLEFLKTNISVIRLLNGVILQVESSSKIKHFEHIFLKLSIPSEQRFSLTAQFELRGTTHFDAHLSLSCKPGYTNMEMKVTGLTVNMYLTTNQGFFGYKTPSDEYSIRIYSKSSGHQLDSEVTVNSGKVQLFKTGLFGMYYNHTDFYILMSTNCIYETLPDTVLSFSATKSEIKFGTEFDYKIGDKRSYSVIINHFMESATNFDIGLTFESNDKETFVTKITHVLKEDLYIALAQVNKDIVKITKINQNNAILVTGTIICADFASDLSGKLLNEISSKGVDLKITWDGDLYQAGGSYNYSDGEFMQAKFNLNSPQTGQYIGQLEYSDTSNLHVLFDRDQSPILLVELSSQKMRTMYILLNTTSTKFMLSEYQSSNYSYELLTSVYYDEKTIQMQYDYDTFPESPDSYRMNATIVTPIRSVGVSSEQFISETYNLSQSYVSWETLDKRVGYKFEITQDDVKTNLKTSVEIPHRTIDLNTHYKLKKVAELTNLECGIQFNWNSKLRLIPVTFVTNVTLDHAQEVAYHYTVLTHPSFNSSFMINGRMTKPNPYENFFNVEMGSVENGIMSPVLRINSNATRKALSSLYQIILEHPKTGIQQQWELNVSYDRGLAAKLSLQRGGENRGFSSVSFAYNSAGKKIEVGLTHNELTADAMGLLTMDKQNKRFGVHASASFDEFMPPIMFTTVVEKPETSSFILTSEINLALQRAYFGEAKWTPNHVSAQLSTHEYDETRTALQAAVTLNTTNTLSFAAKYKSSIWANLTQDLLGSFEHGKIIVKQISRGLCDTTKEEVFARYASIIKSGAVKNVYHTIVEHTTSEINSVRQDLASFRQQVLQIYKRDDFYVKTITEYFIKAFSNSRQASSHALAKVKQAFLDFFTETMPNFYAVMYKNSFEPIVSACQKFSPTFAKSLRKVSSIWNEIYSGGSSVLRTSVSYMQEGVKRISKHTSENMASVSNWAVETKEWVTTDYLEPGKRDLLAAANALETFLKEMNAFFVSLPREIEIYLLSLEEVQEGMQIYKQYAAWLEEFKVARLVAEFKKEFDNLTERFLEDLKEYLGEHAMIVTKVIKAIKGSYDEFMQMPSVVYLRMIYSKVKAKAEFIWEAWEMKMFLQELVIRTANEALAFINKISSSSDDYRKGVLLEDEEYNLRYEPENGELSGSITLPVTWKSFDQLPTLPEDTNEKFHNLRFSLMDKAYEATNLENLQDAIWRTLLPPFRSNALITVNGHVITFDGNHYKVKNVFCGSYLLAADYMDNTFAIVASYGSETEKKAGQLSSLTLYTHNGNKVTIEMTQVSTRTDVDGLSKIFINGSTQVELPLVVDDFELTRQGPKVVALNERGVGLHCNIVNGICSLDLSGWYHGKVAGIMGSFDKEQRNDFAKPDGRVLDSVVEFLEEWKVSGSTDCEMPKKVKTNNNDAGAAVCAQLFSKSSSVLQPCFARLDPEPFRIMCEQDATDGVASDKGPDCLAAEAYVEQCRFVGMDVSLPAHCSRCRLPGRSIAAGDVISFDSSPGSRAPPPPQIADFVFLLEQGSNQNCLQGPHLVDLPAKIDSVLRSTLGINSTKFALASFGAGKPLTIHTIEGNIWSGRRGVQNVMSSLELPKSELAADNKDLRQALFAAASKLHYRPGASKNLILVPCTSCGRSEKTADIFSEASSGLVFTDIKMHVLQRDEMMFKRTITKKTRRGKVNPVMGLDRHGAYTGRRHKGTSLPLASKAIFRQLSLPKDLCTPLVMETNGTLFSASSLFERGASDEKRKWLDVWSRRVASSARPTACQACDCIPLPDGVSRLSCTSCLMPEIEIFLDDWERALDESMQEVLDEDYGSVEVELPDLRTSDIEALKNIRGTLYPGNTFSSDVV